MQKTTLTTCIRRLFLLALPISASSLLNTIANFIAILMVARLGKIELAAAALGISTYMTLMTIVVTSLFSISILIRHAQGQKKAAHEIGDIVKNGLYFAVGITLPVSIVLWFAQRILALFGQNAQLIAIATPYFHYAAIALFPTVIAVTIGQFYIGIGKASFNIITNLIRLPFVILFSYGFIFGKLGLPKLGLGGVMCALFIVQSLYLLGLLLYLRSRDNLKKYQLFSRFFPPNWQLIKQFFNIGMPIGLQFGGELSAMTLATYFMGFLGVTALAASQIVAEYMMLVIMLIIGLTQALSALTSEAFGQENKFLVKRYLIAALILMSGLFAIIISISFIFPVGLIKFYANVEHNQTNAQLIQLGVYLFMIAGVAMFIKGLGDLLSGFLRGLHDSQSAMKISVLCRWVIGLPLSYLLGIYWHGGPILLRLGFVSGFFIALGLLCWRVRKKL